MASVSQRITHCCVNFDRRWLPTPRWVHWAARERAVWTYTRVAAMLGVAVFQWMHKVATNIAYYLHTPREVLTDVGYAVLPPLSVSNQILSEVLFFALAIGTGVFAIGAPLCYPRRGRYTSMMVLRYAYVLVITQLLRILSFLVTSLPGPNYHCRPNSPDYNPPITNDDILSRPDPFRGCGDLVFSSHTIFVTLCVLTFHKYCSHAYIKGGMYVLLVVFGGFVIAARKHYTVDIVVAWYVVALVWVVLDYRMPDTLTPELQALEEMYEAEQRAAAGDSSDIDFSKPHAIADPSDAAAGGVAAAHELIPLNALSASGGAGSNTTSGGSLSSGSSASSAAAAAVAAISNSIQQTLSATAAVIASPDDDADKQHVSPPTSNAGSSLIVPPTGSSVLRQAARDLELGVPPSPAIAPAVAIITTLPTPAASNSGAMTLQMPLIDLSNPNRY